MSDPPRRGNTRRLPTQPKMSRRPLPLPPLEHWQPQPGPTARPSEVHTLPINVQRRIAEAHEILRSPEKLAWVANTRKDSIPATQLHLEEMISFPGRDPKQFLNSQPGQGRCLYRDLKYGDTVPEPLQELIRKDAMGLPSGDEEDKKDDRKTRDRDSGRKSGKGKEAEKRVRGDEMDVDEDEDEKGGVPIGTAESQRKRPR